MTTERVIAFVGAVVVAGHDDRAALARSPAPCQLVANTGVTVYFHDPSGTLFSTQDVVAMVPVQAERMVCAASVPASYRLTR